MFNLNTARSRFPIAYKTRGKRGWLARKEKEEEERIDREGP